MDSLQQMEFRIIAATNKLVVGETYYLPNTYENSGCNVRVLSKSTAYNLSGWPSSVEVEVLETFGAGKNNLYFQVGMKRVVNGMNLQPARQMAA